MDRIWQWAWDRYGARYSWAICAITFPLALPVYLASSLVIVAFEESDRYVEAAAVTVVAVLVLVYVMVLPGLGRIRLVERWAAGHEVDRARALERHLHLGAEGGCPSGGGNAVLGRTAVGSLSVRSPGRAGRGSSSTGSWAPSSELPSS